MGTKGKNREETCVCVLSGRIGNFSKDARATSLSIEHLWIKIWGKWRSGPLERLGKGFPGRATSTSLMRQHPRRVWPHAQSEVDKVETRQVRRRGYLGKGRLLWRFGKAFEPSDGIVSDSQFHSIGLLPCKDEHEGRHG